MKNRLPVPAETRIWRALLYVSCFCGFTFLLIPIIAVVPISFSAGSSLSYPLPGLSMRWYAEVFKSSTLALMLWNSVVVAFFTTIFATVLGTMAAYSSPCRFPAQRDRRPAAHPDGGAPGHHRARLLFRLRQDEHSRQLCRHRARPHGQLATPFVLVTVMATLQGFDRNLVRAALNLGARPFSRVHEHHPAADLPGRRAGAIFAFITSFDEIVVALFVSSPSTKTLPIELYAGLREQLTPAIIAIAALLILFSVAFLGLVQFLLARTRRGRVGAVKA